MTDTSPLHKLNHLALIPDGNTRWAKQQNKPVFEGYRQGMNRGIEIVRAVRELGIHTTTFWGLSTENWQHRPKGELEFLVRLFGRTLSTHLADAMKQDVKIIHLGRKDRLPKTLLRRVADAEEQTKGNERFVLNLALDYGGEDELNRAARAYAEYVAAHGSDDSITLKNFLDTAAQPYPNPDFIIRTSGEQRLSGFMPLSATYSELYFEPCYWPDFTVEKLNHAIAEYAKRQRRFGGGH